MGDAGGSIGAAGPFLGVRRSLSDRAWALRPAEGALVAEIRRRLGLAEPVARALAGRCGSFPEAERHLRPTLRELFPDPSSFRDMDLAAELLLDALVGGRKIVLFADYDVDGATSAALLTRWCRALGHAPDLYIPDRLREGYGPSIPAFQRLKAEGAELIVTLDCGAAAREALEAAALMDLQVVVIDHHQMRPGERPPCAALVNPNQAGCNSGQGDLPAAGVTFVLLAALNREARRRGLFPGVEPDLRALLDLAALGSVCDVTRAQGFNRALIAQGLRVMSGWANPGLRALMEVAGAEGAASVFHAGYILGPRINAGGRIGRSDLGARLLSTDDAAEALVLARELDLLNGERKVIEAQALAAALRQAGQGDVNGPDAPLVLVAGEDWHPGVVGIVAGRLREQSRKPAIVIGVDPVTGIGKGSGRSQPGVDLGRAVTAAFEAGLLIAGGGHAMAAGLTVRKEAIPELRAFLSERLREERARAALEDHLEIDVLASPSVKSASLFEDLATLQPFGPGAPEPLVAFEAVSPEAGQVLKGGHVRTTLASPSGERIRAIAWRAEETALGRRLLSGGGRIHVAGRLKLNTWGGRNSVELEIEDAADPRLSDNFRP